MITILSITVFIMLLYHAYPLWLMLCSPPVVDEEVETEKINSVSVILLSYNGKIFLEKKIDFLLREITAVNDSELIIIDDNSTDGSKELLARYNQFENVRIVLKRDQKGIPHSMNTGVELARYENLVFCDQRQNLCCNIIYKIVEPLRHKHIGAVSAYISHFDKENAHSPIRRFENFIKSKESRLGNLIGVYGPFYAIKKECYPGIPENIILDDLYLSLKIMQTKQVKILEDCRIYDETLSVTHGYERSRRYLKGFLQLLKEKSLIRNLSARQKLMLIWHKYLRLLIPVFLFISFVAIGITGLRNLNYMILFLILSAGGILAICQDFFRIRLSPGNFLRLNVIYFLAMADIAFKELIANRFINSARTRESIPFELL